MGFSVSICEVGPRDGLQNHPRTFSVAERIEMIDRLSSSGLKRIEAVSFVNDRKLPKMAQPEAVLAGIKRPNHLQIAGLALNVRGTERALLCDLHEVRFVIVASETFSIRNQGASIAQTIEAFRQSARLVRAAGKRLGVVIAASFGCPFEGRVPSETVLDLVDVAVDADVQEIVLADTIGAGTPGEVAALVARAKERVGNRALGCHFHNTRNLGYANAYAALLNGATVFDASIGGLGGCPFAPGATGNIATEDLCFMLRQMEYDTGVELDSLLASVGWLEGVLGEKVSGQISRAGLFPEVAQRLTPK